MNHWNDLVLFTHSISSCKMRITSNILLIFIIVFNTYGQIDDQIVADTEVDIPNVLTDFRKNSVSVELLGNGLIWSMNYERFIPVKRDFNITFRGGFSQSGGGDFINQLGLIGESNALLFGAKNSMEIGLGYVYLMDDSRNSYPTIRLSYRHQSKWGMLIKFGFVYVDNTTFWPGLTIGYSF